MKGLGFKSKRAPGDPACDDFHVWKKTGHFASIVAPKSFSSMCRFQMDVRPDLPLRGYPKARNVTIDDGSSAAGRRDMGQERHVVRQREPRFEVETIGGRLILR
jgi:hypothetical protein